MSTGRRPRLAGALFSILLLTCASVPARAERTKPAGPSASASAEGDDEGPDLIHQRILLYLDRHSDGKPFDVERRRERVAAEYERWKDSERGKGRSPKTVGGSQWISLGPTNGAGRMTAIAPHPTDAATVYVGSAGGGVWKSTDTGVTWNPLTEGLNDLSVGALAIAPSAPNVVYLGTGEGGYSVDIIPGIGFLKSTDGGATWNLPASVLSTTFYRISVHPGNADELVVGTMTGAYRSTDGGNSWSNVVSRSVYGDVPDIVRSSSDPRTLYAATWCRTNACTNTTAKVLKSTDGGATWVDKSVGLPQATGLGIDDRMSIAISPSNPSVLYAARAVKNTAGVLISHIYKSTDGGDQWSDLPAVSGSSRFGRYLGDQGWYDNTLVVSPTDPNVLITGGITYLRTSDGGSTFSSVLAAGGVHVDVHDLRYQNSRLWIANDGGIWTSTDDGVSGTDRNSGLVTRQYYSLAIDPVNRNRILAGAQDNGTGQRTDAGGTTWRAVIGADGFECGINPVSPSIAWATIQFGVVERTRNAGSGELPGFENVTPPYENGEQTPFLSILKVDPAAPDTIYTGSYRLWRSRDGGTTWVPLPTTTTDSSAWLSTTNITSTALSRTDPLLLIVGKGRGIFRSGDGGNTWAAGAGLPNSIVNNVEIDPTNSNIAYAAISTVSGPSVYRSDNGGLNWTASANGLPPFAAQVVRIDPTDAAVVFCGTDVGVFRSSDRGASWSRFGSGLPASSIHELQISDDGSILRAATHGRGIWELEVPPTGNSPPASTITAPGARTIVRGSSLSFAGFVADPDAGDTVVGTWFFPDTGEALPLPRSGAAVTHNFRRGGLFPVALTARDSRGALGSSIVVITVTEPEDACATPIILPGGGPFPFSVTVDNETATAQAGDPVPPCVPVGTGTFGSVWFEFTSPTTSSWEFSTCGALADTVLSVHTGPQCGPYTAVASGCNDDTTATGCGQQASLVTVAATAGQTLRVQATAFAPNSTGSFPLIVRPAAAAAGGPRVSGISIPEGPAPGGTTVLVTGRDFSAGMTVEFGGAPATDVVVYGPTTLSATTPAHAPELVDVTVRGTNGAGVLSNAYTYTAFTPTACAPGGSTLCLNGGRFKVEAAWRVPADSTSGQASAAPLTADTGYFWFFTANNIELVVKVVDGRTANGKFWVFCGALSNVEYTITVTDVQTGIAKVYTNPNGQQSSLADTAAF